MIHGYENFLKNKNIFNRPKFKYNDNELYSSYKPRNDSGSFYFEGNMLRVEGLRFGETILTSSKYNYRKTDNIKYINPIIYRNNRTMKYYLNFVTIENKLDDYFIINNIPKSPPIGVDINKHSIYACSDGTTIYSRDISRLEYHIAELDRQIRKDIDSNNNSNNAKFRLEKRRKLYCHISNIFKDTCYKGSLEIIRKNPKAIIMETLNIKSIMSHHYIAKNISHYPFGIAQRILAEQSFKYNIPVYYTPINFQSSNICSYCGTIRDDVTNSYFNCPVCNLRINRDLNASINLKKWYEREYENGIHSTIYFYQ